MKFGHELQRVISVSDPEWAPYFIQYKLLKKFINGLSLCEDETLAFFRALRSELEKSSRFFRAAQHILEIRRDRIDQALRSDVRNAALSACVSYYKDLLLLENFAIMNFIGYSKILKKHDKRTGIDTRTRFMKLCVAPQPFTHYPNLLKMIREAEASYRTISLPEDPDPKDFLMPEKEQPEPSPPSSSSSRNRDDAPLNESSKQLSKIRREDSDLIDAILNLRSEASRLRASEEEQNILSTTTHPPSSHE